VELPTYTNIWKIEKRLYKLYDFRLPMPLPVGQIAAFLAIAVPYTLILTMVGMPFSHTWLWLYILPPGVLAWLVTRPVLEGKRLPELVHSQLRYLSEPRTWCRLAPLTEKDEVVLVARVWRSARSVRPSERPAVDAAAQPEFSWPAAAQPWPAVPPQTEQERAAAQSAPAWPTAPYRGAAAVRRPGSAAPRRSGMQPGPVQPGPVQTGPVQTGPVQPGLVRPGVAQRDPAQNETAQPDPALREADRVRVPLRAAVADAAALAAAQPLPPAAITVTPLTESLAPEALAPEALAPAAPAPETPAPETAADPAPAADRQPAPPRRPAVRVTADPGPARQLNVVERALRNSPGTVSPGTAGFRDAVIVVPGGHRPGKPDQVQRDQARVRLALQGPARIVVLGCTAGAGQTITTLLTGQLLASLRGEAVAVLDLRQGPASLTEQARFIPALMPSRRASAGAGAGAAQAAASGERGLQVVTAADSSDDPGQIISAVAARYPLTLADPEAGGVPRVLRAADQLILVAPASAEAAGSLAMTVEWLQAHDHSALAANAIVVLNGVSSQTADLAEKTAAVASGRSRAIVRVPWDDRIRSREPLAAATIHAYTALAGVLVAAFADASAASGTVHTGSGR
jgi:MinD-like ATPase involved in chromosome partitioning or flagellar assembly